MAHSCTSDLYAVSNQSKECSLLGFSKFLQSGDGDQYGSSSLPICMLGTHHLAHLPK